MRRSLILAALVPALLIAGCGGYTPAEEAFLAQVQKASSEITLSDPDEHLEHGHQLCDGAAKLKPADRGTVMFMTAQQLGWMLDYNAARATLCPDMLD